MSRLGLAQKREVHGVYHEPSIVTTRCAVTCTVAGASPSGGVDIDGKNAELSTHSASTERAARWERFLPAYSPPMPSMTL